MTETSLLALATTQGGMFTRSDAHEHGLDWRRLQTRIDQGALVSVTRSVLAVAGVPITDTRRLHAAVLEHGPDAVVSRWSAAAVWDLPGFTLLPSHVMVVRDGRGREEARRGLHSTRYLPEDHIVRVDGLAVTTPTRTVFDLLPDVHPGRRAQVLDHMWRRNLTSGDLVHDMHEELRGRGQRHVSIVEAVLEDRPRDYLPPDSNLEARFQTVVHEIGGSRYRRQVHVGDETTWLGHVDFIDEVLPHICQIDGSHWHRALVDAAKDEAQTAALRAAGFVLDRITEFMVWHRPNQVRAIVRAGRAEARALVAARRRAA